MLGALAASLAILGGASVAQAAEGGPQWRELSAQQRAVLKPLERDWSDIDATRKQKWLDIAARYPKMPPDEQGRISNRMNAWAKMTPTERGQARLNFQEARQLPRQERQAGWEAYQALTPEQKQQFATRGAPAATARSGEVPRRPGASKEAAAAPQGKSNIVPNPAYTAPRKAVAPTIVQAQPGATTTLINKRPVPPSHQQPGLPKIAATPGFVDKQTLLPQRGAQAAAIRSAAASDAQPKRAR
jgi:hypothetical protein